MNPFKCRHCDLPAHFYFRDGGMLCVDHAEAFCLAQAQDMMARSRLDKSSCGDVKESSASIPEYNGVKSPALLTAHGLSGKSCPLSRSEVGPQDSLSPPTVLSPPVAGALAEPCPPCSAGAALSDDLPIFPERRNATASRVIASSATQVPKSSSDMSFNSHHGSSNAV